MKKTYINITITYYSNKHTAPDVHYYRDDDIHPIISTWDKLTPTEANLLMWELVKLGGKNEYYSNRYNNAISTRQVTFWGFL